MSLKSKIREKTPELRMCVYCVYVAVLNTWTVCMASSICLLGFDRDARARVRFYVKGRPGGAPTLRRGGRVRDPDGNQIKVKGHSRTWPWPAPFRQLSRARESKSLRLSSSWPAQCIRTQISNRLSVGMMHDIP